MIRDLILSNRSCRRFDEGFVIERRTLEELVDLARLSASAANLQPLKYILSCEPEENARIFQHVAWAAYLKDWGGPAPGERPSAYLILLGDTGAYLVGVLLGRHKMAPLASPNKTWEGCAGGILFGVLGAWAAKVLLLNDLNLALALGTGAAVHAVAQLSDPLESLFKRAVGVKDSSNILPGHGGFLDRFDSFILAGPFFYYFIRYFWK